jgi:nucleoside-diphosphate-sugar epimerase
MKILVTGAAGFVGRTLVSLLKRAGHEPFALVRPGTDVACLDALKIPYYRDDGVAKLSEGLRPFVPFDGVIHLASFFVSAHNEGDVSHLIESNVLFPARVIDAAVNLGAHWFIQTDTTWQHYNGKAYSPVDLYAATKQAFDSVIQFYRETAPVRFAALALSDTYGPNDTRPKLLNLWCKIAGTTQTMQMSSGLQRMELLYVDDIAEAFRLLAEHLGTGAAVPDWPYTLDTGRYPTLREVALIFEKVTGKRLPIEWGARPMRPREMMIPWHSGLSVPGWRPATTLEDGIAKVYASYCAPNVPGGPAGRRGA